jgi:hypothetical protein
MQSTQMTIMALLLAHLLGDFPLQIQWIASNKGRRIWPLICHGAMHYFLAWTCLLLFTQVSYFAISSQIIVLAYVALHLLIDRIKHRITAWKPSLDNWQTFLTDQALHLSVLIVAACLLTKTWISQLIEGAQLSTSMKTHALETAIVYVAVVFGGGYLIRYLTRNYAAVDQAHTASKLKNAGLYVGWLERFLIVTAIAMQSPILAGLIMTGKSIARFPESFCCNCGMELFR